ncbi:hypothetical protein PanWU01x14_008970, partial [Parasponia andersonii]
KKTGMFQKQRGLQLLMHQIRKLEAGDRRQKESVPLESFQRRREKLQLKNQKKKRERNKIGLHQN